MLLTAALETGFMQVGCGRCLVMARADTSRLHAVLSVQAFEYPRKCAEDRTALKVFVSVLCLGRHIESQSRQVAMIFLLATSQQALFATIGEPSLTRSCCVPVPHLPHPLPILRAHVPTLPWRATVLPPHPARAVYIDHRLQRGSH